MRRRWWCRLAQYIAYPIWWPTVFAWDIPNGDELPSRIAVERNGRTAWYQLESD